MRSIGVACLLAWTVTAWTASTLVSESWAMDSTWVRLWREDLETARTKFPEAHANLFHTLPRAEFDSSLTALAGKLAGLSHAEATMELARLLARVGDGHTRLTLPVRESAGFFQGHSRTEPPKVPGLVFGDLPIRFGLAQDTLFVRAVTSQRAELLGAEVLRIGDLDAKSAMHRVRPYLHHDNDMQIQDLLPDYLVLPDVLEAAGVVSGNGPVAMQFRLWDGRTVDAELVPAGEEATFAWTERPERKGRVPGTETRRAEPFWFERVPETATVYFQFNEVSNGDDETLAAFCERLGEYVETNRIDRLIVDLRANHGGNNHLNRSLLHELVRLDRVNRSGGLFVLIGRSTFSAAVMLSVDLQEHTQALFVGEPTGGSPNGYGDSRKVRLPNTGLTARLSTLYWQYAGPGDDREWIAPHLSAPRSRSAWWVGRDPGLEAVLQEGAWAPRLDTAKFRAVAEWEGFGTLDDETQAMVMRWRDEGGTVSARMDLPGFGANDLELANAERSETGLAFALPIQNGTLHFEAQPEGNRLYGTVSLHGLRAPFVLWPASGR